jgi:hypothetical protein
LTALWIAILRPVSALTAFRIGQVKAVTSLTDPTCAQPKPRGADAIECTTAGDTGGEAPVEVSVLPQRGLATRARL